MTLKTTFSRMGKVRATLLTMLLSLMIVCTALAFVFPTTRHANADELFQCSNSVTLEKNSIAYNGFLQNRTGYAFSTTENAANFVLADKMSGEFYVEFIPVSSQRGINDFNKFSFTFTEESSRLAFSVAFSAHPNGVLMTLSLSNTNKITKEILTEGSFSNLADEPIKFKFDPVNMIISDATGVVLGNLKDVASINSFNATDIFKSFVEYSVEMSFSEIVEDKTAKVVMFDIAGQSLSGATLTDTDAPIVVGEPVFNNAVKGVPYNIEKAIKTYDVIDGYSKQFKGDIKVYNFEGDEVEVVNGSFTPEIAQNYYLSYTPIDEAGNAGATYSYPIVVFENHPEIIFDYEYKMEDVTLGEGVTLAFPGVTAKSDLVNGAMQVSATLKLGDVSVYQLTNASKGFDYEFTKQGTYVLTYSATDSNNGIREDSYTIVINDDKIFDNFEIDREYRKNGSIDLTAVSVRGEDTLANIYAVYPDGRTYQNVNSLSLDIEGMYSITASANVNGTTISQTKYFNVKTDNAYLWKETEGLTVTSNYDAPSYADGDYNGTLLTASRPLEVEYTNIINLKDNTLNDILFEMFIAPESVGVKELDTIDFIFTDIYDESNCIIVRLEWGSWGYYQERVSVIAMRDKDYKFSNGTNRPGVNNQHQVYYQNLVWSSLYGKISTAEDNYPSQKISFYFDYETGLLYATPAATSANTFKAKVGDFTDDRFDAIGEGNPYHGFTTGEVRLSVRFMNLYQNANVMVLNIDGQSMSGQYNSDNVAPSVFVDYQGNSEDNLPYAQVGEYFNLFPAVAHDVTGGTFSNIVTNVYKRLSNGDWEEIAKETTRFIPEEAGEYKLLYTAKDSAGNVGTKEVYLTAIETIPTIEYNFSSKNPSELVVGHQYTIYNGSMKGGSGALTENLKVMLGDKEIKLDKFGRFVPTEEGEYVITVTVKDYIGETEPWTYVMNASYDSAPVLNAITVPTAIRVGAPYVLPEFTAIDYSTDGNDTVALDAYVDGQKVEDSYTPTQAGEITLALKYGDILVETFNITVVDQGGENGHFIYQYFNTNVSSKSIDVNGVTFNMDTDAYIDVVEKVDVHFLNIGFTLIKADGIGEIDMVMTDSVDPSATVTLSFKPLDTKKSYATLCGKTTEINGTFLTGGSLLDSVISYNYKNDVITYSGSTVGTITKFDNGEIFNGFPSGNVYVSFTFKNVTVSSAVMIKSIASQYMISSIKEGKQPIIEVLGENNNIEIGEEFTVFTAAAYEFLVGVESCTVKVTAPGGAVLLNNQPADKEYKITAEKYGTYTILYTATSNIGRTRTKRVAVSISNRQPPVITVDGELPTGVLSGTTLDIPTASAMASTEDVTLSILYLQPGDEYLYVKDGKVTFTTKGNWYIVYFAQDSEGVSSVKMFKITVV